MKKLAVLPPIRKRELRALEARKLLPVAFRTLRTEVGLPKTLRILLAIATRGTFHAPLRSLPPPENEADVLTRMQLRPVVLLYDTLREDIHCDKADAVRIVHALVQRCGVVFLQWILGPFDLETWRSASGVERDSIADSLLKRMFNIRAAEPSLSGATLSFRVTDCGFVRLLAILDRPELAPLFCEVDRTFFDRPESPFRLTRTTTLANDGACCDFSFTIAGGRTR